jgi:hypothetical protein
VRGARRRAESVEDEPTSLLVENRESITRGLAWRSGFVAGREPDSRVPGTYSRMV